MAEPARLQVDLKKPRYEGRDADGQTSAAYLAGYSAMGNQAALAQAEEQTIDYAGNFLETQAAHEETLGFMGKFARFFSRKIDFTVNGSSITGKNGYQAKGGIVEVMGGGVLNLKPATLTGYITDGVRGAKGSGARLMLASKRERSIYEVKLREIELNDRGLIDGKSEAALSFPTKHHGILRVDEVRLRRDKREGAPRVELRGVSLAGGQENSSVGGDHTTQNGFELPELPMPAAEQTVLSSEASKDQPIPTQAAAPEIPPEQALQNLRIAGQPIQWIDAVGQDGIYHAQGAEIELPLWDNMGARGKVRWRVTDAIDPEKGNETLHLADGVFSQPPRNYNALFQYHKGAIALHNQVLSITDEVYFKDGLPIAPKGQAGKNKLKIQILAGQPPTLQFEEKNLEARFTRTDVTLFGDPLLFDGEKETILFQGARIKQAGFGDLDLNMANSLNAWGELGVWQVQDQEKKTAAFESKQEGGEAEKKAGVKPCSNKKTKQLVRKEYLKDQASKRSLESKRKDQLKEEKELQKARKKTQEQLERLRGKENNRRNPQLESVADTESPKDMGDISKPSTMASGWKETKREARQAKSSQEIQRKKLQAEEDLKAAAARLLEMEEKKRQIEMEEAEVDARIAQREQITAAYLSRFPSAPEEKPAKKKKFYTDEKKAELKKKLRQSIQAQIYGGVTDVEEKPEGVTTLDKSLFFKGKTPLRMKVVEGRPQLRSEGQLTFADQPFSFVPGLAATERLEKRKRKDLKGEEQCPGVIKGTTIEDWVDVEFADGSILNADLPAFETTYLMTGRPGVGTVSFEGARIADGFFYAETMEINHDEWKREQEKAGEGGEVLGGEESEKPSILERMKTLRDAGHWTQREIYKNVSLKEARDKRPDKTEIEGDTPKNTTELGAFLAQESKRGQGIVEFKPADELELAYDVDNSKVTMEFSKEYDPGESVFGNARVHFNFSPVPPVELFFEFAPILSVGGSGELETSWKKEEDEPKRELVFAGEVSLNARLGIAVAAGVGVSAGVAALRAQLKLEAAALADAEMKGEFKVGVAQRETEQNQPEKEQKVPNKKTKYDVHLDRVELSGKLSFALEMAIKAQLAASFLVWQRTLLSYTLGSWKTPALEIEGKVNRDGDGNWGTSVSAQALGKKFEKDNKEIISSQVVGSVRKESESEASYNRAAAAFSGAQANIMASGKDVAVIADEMKTLLELYNAAMKAALDERETVVKAFKEMIGEKSDYLQSKREVSQTRKTMGMINKDITAKTKGEDEKSIDQTKLDKNTLKRTERKSGGKDGFGTVVDANKLQEKDLPTAKALFDRHNIHRMRNYLTSLQGKVQAEEGNSALATQLGKIKHEDGAALYTAWHALCKEQGAALRELYEDPKKGSQQQQNDTKGKAERRKQMREDFKALEKHDDRQTKIEQLMNPGEGQKVDMKALRKSNLLTYGLRKDIYGDQVNAGDVQAFYERRMESARSREELLYREKFLPLMETLLAIEARCGRVSDMIKKVGEVQQHAKDLLPKPSMPDEPGTSREMPVARTEPPIIVVNTQRSLQIALGALFGMKAQEKSGVLDAQKQEAEETTGQLKKLGAELKTAWDPKE